ncbi:metallophosphoesterase [Spectribacter hydrogenooxidans]|uniref:Metallophosphoesterase n=1 Tax=Spectribacter hydrogenoxidans TaxID=3075608 RepID=A0ABU3BY77_9GAMM|nr:metallophosphoesterase [Salinisphaera sp. W335]MDT0634271.1 metallophosphoesterase [Salinisphaera sp. W335]
MPTSALLIQLTDLHLLADPAEPLGGCHNQPALDAVLADVRQRYPAPDGLVLTGDLVHDETPAGYQRLARQLAGLPCPIWAIPGNHDDPAAMKQYLTGIGLRGPVSIGAWQLHLLDSRVAGSAAGRLGQPQMAALLDALDRSPDTPALVACHHPAGPVGAGWLDAMRLADGDALLSQLAARPQVRALIGGHVHHSSDRRVLGCRQLTTPAVTRQFRPRSERPVMDHAHAPGYRVFRLGGNGELRTRVHRVPTARTALRGNPPVDKIGDKSRQGR